MNLCLLGDADEAKSDDVEHTFSVARALWLVTLSSTFMLSDGIWVWSGGAVKKELLLMGNVASCPCGHDSSVRYKLVEAQHNWTLVVLMLCGSLTRSGCGLEEPSRWSRFWFATWPLVTAARFETNRWNHCTSGRTS